MRTLNRQGIDRRIDLFESEQQRNLNRLEAALSRHWPELVQILDLHRVSLLSLISEYGSPQAVATDPLLTQMAEVVGKTTSLMYKSHKRPKQAMAGSTSTAAG